MSLAPGPFAAARTILLTAIAAHARGPAGPTPDSPYSPDHAEQARQEVLAGRAAFDAGDYTGALARFEAARTPRPSPKVLYNVGVCHMRLYRRASGRGDAQARDLHAAAAVEAFNTYLRDRPTAEDRVEVEDMIRALGGTPATQAQLRDPLRPIDLPPAPPPDIKRADPPTPARAPPTPTAPVKPAPPEDPLPRGYLGVLVGVAVQPQLTTRSDLRGGVAGLLALRGGARLGPRRRVELGGQLAFAVPDATVRAAPLDHDDRPRRRPRRPARSRSAHGAADRRPRRARA